MPSTAGTVITRAAAHLNDPSQLSYTTAVLLPFLNMAIDELGEELGVYELSPLKKDSITILIDSGDVQLDEMPVDFVEAIRLLERAQGSSDRWREVTEVAEIDDNFSVDTSTEILQWTIRNTTIRINPPSSDREVQLEYIHGLTEAGSADTAIDIEISRRFLALVTARNAARDLGNAPNKAASFEPDIDRARDRLTRRLQKNSQSTMGVRRRPYTGRSW